MKVAVVGCGSIGGIIAATLIRGGHDVTPVIRNPKLAEIIATHGFRVHELNGESWNIALKQPSVPSLKNLSGFDFAVMATPNTTLGSALLDTQPALKPGAPFILCSNGLPEDRARRIVGDDVLGCVVGWGASMKEPGMYYWTSSGGLQIGRLWDSAPNPQPYADALQSNSETFVVDNLAPIRWSKLAINCVTAALGAIGGDTLGNLLLYSLVRRLAMEVFAEVIAVAHALCIEPSPVRGTLKIDKVAITPAERRGWKPSLIYKHLLMLAVGAKFRRMRSSMLYALEHGREIEIDYLNGEVVERGKLKGVPTPVNEAVIRTVREVEKKKLPPAPQTLLNLARSCVRS